MGILVMRAFWRAIAQLGRTVRMDNIYLSAREQASLAMARDAACAEARRAHCGMAMAYRRLLGEAGVARPPAGPGVARNG